MCHLERMEEDRMPKKIDLHSRNGRDDTKRKGWREEVE
jgi:hypothetical protein